MSSTMRTPGGFGDVWMNWAAIRVGERWAELFLRHGSSRTTAARAFLALSVIWLIVVSIFEPWLLVFPGSPILLGFFPLWGLAGWREDFSGELQQQESKMGTAFRYLGFFLLAAETVSAFSYNNLTLGLLLTAGLVVMVQSPGTVVMTVLSYE